MKNHGISRRQTALPDTSTRHHYQTWSWMWRLWGPHWYGTFILQNELFWSLKKMYPKVLLLSDLKFKYKLLKKIIPRCLGKNKATWASNSSHVLKTIGSLLVVINWQILYYNNKKSCTLIKWEINNKFQRELFCWAFDQFKTIISKSLQNILQGCS